VHLVFGTKNRNSWLNLEFESQLHGLMTNILVNLDCPVLIINSVPDHVHILFRMSKNHTLATVVAELKRKSSKWVKTIVGGAADFHWQKGYGAFSVSSTKLDVVRRYIENQKEHHKNTSFQNEMEYFSERYGFDPNHFWD